MTKNADGRVSYQAKDSRYFRAAIVMTGKTVRQLGELGGFANSTLVNLASGRRTCSADMAERVARALNVDLDALFTPVDRRLTHARPRARRTHRECS